MYQSITAKESKDSKDSVYFHRMGSKWAAVHTLSPKHNRLVKNDKNDSKECHDTCIHPRSHGNLTAVQQTEKYSSTYLPNQVHVTAQRLKKAPTFHNLKPNQTTLAPCHLSFPFFSVWLLRSSATPLLQPQRLSHTTYACMHGQGQAAASNGRSSMPAVGVKRARKIPGYCRILGR
jgi:hypothetical protein